MPLDSLEHWMHTHDDQLTVQSWFAEMEVNDF